MEIPVHIVRTRNRSSRAVLENDCITIRLAHGLTTDLEREHIEVLTRRMSKAHAREATKQCIEPFGELLEGFTTRAVVQPCIRKPIIYTLVEGTKTRGIRTEEGWKVWRNPRMDRKAFHGFLWKLLGISLEVDVAREVRRVNAETMNVRIQSVSLKNMRSRWGSCSHSGSIALSTPLLLTSREILRYVIVHELAHTVHMNHSRSFWTLVQEHCPDYRERIRELRTYRISKI